MSRLSALRARAALVAAALLFAGSCADGKETDGSSPRMTASTTTPGAEDRSDEAHLMLLEEPTWQLTEAVDYRAGLGRLEAQDPDLDWFAEYDGPRVDNADGSYTIPHVATFGHAAGLERRRSQLPGFEHRSEVVHGRRALVSPSADGNPAVLILEVAADYTATLLTYDTGVNLNELAANLAAVDDQQWTAAGGSLLDCVPFESGCTDQS